MSKFYTLILLLIPSFIFSLDNDVTGLLQIDVIVKVISAESEELWSVDVTKYTINNRSISLNLKGFDAELIAIMTPVLVGNDSVILRAEATVKNLETKKILHVSEMDLTVKFDEKVILYPIGNLKNAPNVIMELNITKHNGVDI